MRVVIVEDNESVAKGIAYVLRDTGYAVDLLHDGEEADSFLRDDGADLIILDVKLPGLNGIEVLRNLRRRGDARPVLILTAQGDTQERITGLDAGADDYLVKPFSFAELSARITANLAKNSTSKTHTSAYNGVEIDENTLVFHFV